MDLVLKTEVTGPQLIKEIMRREPGLSIDSVLNFARKIQVERHANVLRDLKFDSVLDIIKHIHGLDLVAEDVNDLVTSVADEIPELDALLQAGIFEAIYNLAKPPPEPTQPRGCFCFSTRNPSRSSRASSTQSSAPPQNRA